MAPSKKASKASSSSSTTAASSAPPKPFKVAPDSLKPFFSDLSKKHIYIAHVDTKPRDFKLKIFIVPVAMNVVVALLFAWRIYYIAPYYLLLLASTLGYPNELTLQASELTYSALLYAILRRTFTFLLDFLLGVFVWPWPVEFAFGSALRRGSPVGWRWAVGFRDKEIYLRRSRDWDKTIGDVIADDNGSGRNEFFSHVNSATSPMLLQEKTGYLTMNGEWDLDWAGMVHATRLVDNKVLAMDAFTTPLVLLHNDRFGWMCVDMNTGANAKEDERRRQVFQFRDALAAVGKENLFFRWIEIVQFETSQPGGFTGKKQIETAQKIRDLFKEEGIDFDEFWMQSVGSASLAGMD
ncbi:hypothetical protein QBC37DRAFT_412571 [Rhypophila decipiens]|uniref:Uncharacterized protein n=1 Tax=Rhypophila decipiens TaxID=261697 RepID=A0AAN6YFN6_9PEZI|nr:hypothetical protein QBC37DRAFT_412571 [Rhypophila decipiens]